MSQLEDKKSEKLVKSDDQEENRLPVGELKWSKEEEQASESKEGEATKEESSKSPTQSEVSATLAVDEVIEEDVSPNKSKTLNESAKDPLAGIEDTLTSIDFKEYEFEPDELKTVEKESNSFDQQTLERKEDFQEYEVEQSSGNKWIKRIIWILGIPAFLILVLFISLMIGHTVIGGQPVGEIFDVAMWQHLYNLIYG
jgi:hypothetical protein